MLAGGLPRKGAVLVVWLVVGARKPDVMFVVVLEVVVVVVVVLEVVVGKPVLRPLFEFDVGASETDCPCGLGFVVRRPTSTLRGGGAALANCAADTRQTPAKAATPSDLYNEAMTSLHP